MVSATQMVIDLEELFLKKRSLHPLHVSVSAACCQSNDIYMYILSKVVCMKSYIITLYILLSYFIILGCWDGGSIWSYLDVSCKSILTRN